MGDAFQGGADIAEQLADLLAAGGIQLRESEVSDLIAFVRTGLLDSRAKKENLCRLVPSKLPSGLKPLNFEACK